MLKDRPLKSWKLSSIICSLRARHFLMKPLEDRRARGDEMIHRVQQGHISCKRFYNVQLLNEYRWVPQKNVQFFTLIQNLQLNLYTSSRCGENKK